MPDIVPAPPEPRRPRPRFALELLAVIAGLSLVANIVLVVRADEASRDARRDRDRVAALQDEVERLERERPTPAGSPGGDVIGAVAQAVARLRGLAFKSAVVPEVLSPEALRKRVEEEFAKEDSRSEIDVTDKVLTALGLLAPGDDLYQILLKVNTEQVAGYYDDEKKRLVVAGSQTLTPYDRVLLAHELVHALTDQHFDLTRIERLEDQRKDDEATALLSLVEGDATLMMLLYRETLTEEEKAAFARQAEEVDSPELEAAPAVLRASLLFPYDQGTQFVNTLYLRGGVKAIDDAYRRPPASTEQILHPQKYVNRDDPQPVSLPDVRAALGEGWREIDAGSAGELDVRLIADQFLPDADAASIADGWDGGAYAAFESSAGTVVAMETVWDSADEARRAAEGLTEWLRPRFASKGSPYRPGTGIAGWDAGSAAAEVARSGDRVVLIVGPDRPTVERARGAFAGLG